jgi:nucleoid-associated protein YgaU
MSNTADQRQASVEHAVKVKALARLAIEIGIGEALKVIAAATDATPRELAAAGRQAHRAEVVAEIVRLEKEGRGRDAVSIVVGEYVIDRRDSIEVDSLSRKFRRWRDAERRTHVRPSAAR